METKTISKLDLIRSEVQIVIEFLNEGKITESIESLRHVQSTISDWIGMEYQSNDKKPRMLNMDEQVLSVLRKLNRWERLPCVNICERLKERGVTDHYNNEKSMINSVGRTLRKLIEQNKVFKVRHGKDWYYGLKQTLVN